MPATDCTLMRNTHNQLRRFDFVHFEKASPTDYILTAKEDEPTFILNDHYVDVPEASAESLRTGGFMSNDFCCSITK